LTTELTDAEAYQEAYHALSEEVGSLVARNQLAEEEAQRLSTFNAEILSHKNPAQRIMYVDRIRRELAETKHVCYPSLLLSVACKIDTILTETCHVDSRARECCGRKRGAAA
jgi:hypothetical protein